MQVAINEFFREHLHGAGECEIFLPVAIDHPLALGFVRLPRDTLVRREPLRVDEQWLVASLAAVASDLPSVIQDTWLLDVGRVSDRFCFCFAPTA